MSRKSKMLPSYAKNNPHQHNSKWSENVDFICDECDVAGNRPGVLLHGSAWRCKACYYDCCEQCVTIGVIMSIRKNKENAAKVAQATRAREGNSALEDGPPAKKQKMKKQSPPESSEEVDSDEEDSDDDDDVDDNDVDDDGDDDDDDDDDNDKDDEIFSISISSPLVSSVSSPQANKVNGNEIEEEEWECSHCSFSGSFSQVTHHEKSCNHCLSSASSSSSSSSPSYSSPALPLPVQSKEMMEEEHKLKTLFWKHYGNVEDDFDELVRLINHIRTKHDPHFLNCICGVMPRGGNTAFTNPRECHSCHWRNTKKYPSQAASNDTSKRIIEPPTWLAPVTGWDSTTPPRICLPREIDEFCLHGGCGHYFESLKTIIVFIMMRGGCKRKCTKEIVSGSYSSATRVTNRSLSVQHFQRSKKALVGLGLFSSDYRNWALKFVNKFTKELGGNKACVIYVGEFFGNDMSMIAYNCLEHAGFGFGLNGVPSQISYVSQGMNNDHLPLALQEKTELIEEIILRADESAAKTAQQTLPILS